jgi:group I intron endonuclease
LPIYLITNIKENKYYVGVTRQKILARWKNHCDMARRDSNSGYYLHRAMRRDGLESFDIQELSKESDPEKLKNLERVWIILLQSRSDAYGYNLTAGGDGTTGYKYTKKQRQDLSERTKRIFKERPEIRQKMSDSRKGIPAWNKGIPQPHTHCRNGHLLSEDNLINRKKEVYRSCLTCHRERQRIRVGYYVRNPHANHL